MVVRAVDNKRIMKKVIFLAIIASVVLTGCNNNNKSFYNSNTSVKSASVKKASASIQKVPDSIQKASDSTQATKGTFEPSLNTTQIEQEAKNTTSAIYSSEPIVDNTDNNINDGESNKSQIYGNTMGNINNFGWMVQKDNWLYYNNFSNSGIYKYNINTGERLLMVKMDINFASYFNIIGDWLYCIFNNDGNIYKININTYETIKLTNDPYKKSYFLIVIDDWLYYYKKEKYGSLLLYKVNNNGNDIKEFDLPIGHMNISNGWIYYQDQVDRKIYKVDLEGNNKSIVAEANLYMNLIVIGDYMYYSNLKGIFKYDLKSGVEVKLTNNIAEHALNVDNGWIYYTNEKDSNKLYRVNDDGSIDEKIYDGKDIGSINIINDWIYISSGATRVKLDGSIVEEFFN